MYHLVKLYENHKAHRTKWSHFTFLPIEPPRETHEGETYARRQHQFLPDSASFGTGKKKGSIFGALSSKSPVEPKSPDNPIGDTLQPQPPPRFSVDVRLPNPAVLTCNSDLPLRILVKQLSSRKSNLYLQMLHIELIGYTQVRAQDLARSETSVWVIVSMSNMAIPLGSPTDEINKEVSINREYWQGNPLPSTVAPSFEACNISRRYELEVRVGLGYGSYEHGRDQLVVLPLRLPVKVYSGIAPPAALLQAMKSGNIPSKIEEPPSLPSGKPPPFSPTEGEASSSAPSQAPPSYEEAPPSYEDTVAHDMPPVEGPRSNYTHQPFSEGEPNFPGDRKS
jgi:hypothetical protein